MPEVEIPFFKLIEDKGHLWVASKLSHETTTKICRWIKEKKVPGIHKYAVYSLLKNEGYIS